MVRNLRDMVAREISEWALIFSLQDDTANDYIQWAKMLLREGFGATWDNMTRKGAAKKFCSWHVTFSDDVDYEGFVQLFEE